MCSNHPKFDVDLLPEYLGIQFTYFNQGAARKIIIAEVLAGPISEGALPKIMGSGHAICAPMDTYDEERGKAIATGRAIKQWWKAEQVARAIQTFTAARHGG